MSMSRQHLDWQSSCILSRIDDWHSEGFQLCNSLFRQYHNIQQNSRRISITHQNGIQETPFSKTFNETQQVSIFLQGNPVFRTHFEHKRDLTTTIKNTSDSTNAATHYP